MNEINDYHKTIHELKCRTEYYIDVRRGVKTFELRLDDRNYAVGDLLILREWGPDAGYTGYVTCAVVTCLVRNEEWLQPGYVALGIRVLR